MGYRSQGRFFHSCQLTWLTQSTLSLRHSLRSVYTTVYAPVYATEMLAGAGLCGFQFRIPSINRSTASVSARETESKAGKLASWPALCFAEQVRSTHLEKIYGSLQAQHVLTGILKGILQTQRCVYAQHRAMFHPEPAAAFTKDQEPAQARRQGRSRTWKV